MSWERETLLELQKVLRCVWIKYSKLRKISVKIRGCSKLGEFVAAGKMLRDAPVGVVVVAEERRGAAGERSVEERTACASGSNVRQ